MSSVDVAHGVDELSDAPTSHGESSGVRRRWLTGWCLVRGRVSVRTRIAAWSVLLLTASMLITVLVTHEL
ncbi:MAG: hypothetical protein J2P16_09665, partial [Mycobacterium sp.]|nr:hypothetical protein [Mycobacterium sp.]